MNWKEYLEHYFIENRKELDSYSYPVSDWSTDKGVLVQDPFKIKTEQLLISKILSNDWEIAMDYGCGVGTNFFLFDKRSENERFLIGIDPDCTRIELANIIANNLLENIEYRIICSNHEVLINAPDTLKVDQILCSQVLGHVSRKKLYQIIRGFHHIISEEGTCTLLVPVVGERFKNHLQHTNSWNGKNDYTHIVNVSFSPENPKFRQYVDPFKFDIITNNPKENQLPVRSFILPDFPEPSSTKLPCPLERIPSTLSSIIGQFFTVKESYLYSIHRDTPESNYPIGDILILLHKLR